MIATVVASFELFLRLNLNFEILKPYKIASSKFKQYNEVMSLASAIEKYNVDPTSIPSEFQEREWPESALSDPKLTVDYTGTHEFHSLLQAVHINNTSQTIVSEARFSPPYENILIYQASYNLNSHLQRIVENKNTHTERFFLALGDSFTFGEGVATGFDYPSQLQKKVPPNWQVYNLARPGSGPNDLLRFVETQPEFLSDVTEKSGIAVWYFIEDHFERFLCTYQCAKPDRADFYLKKPRYTEVNGNLLFSGTFYSYHQNDFHFLANSKLYQLFFSNKLFDYSASELSLLSKSFSTIRSRLHDSKKIDHFYILFTHDFPQKKEFIEKLKEQNIEIIDLAGYPFYLAKSSIYPIDQHPTKTFYWLLSELLLRQQLFE